jgi:zinc transporter ZupT
LQLLTSIGALAGTLVGSHLGNVYMQECLAFTSGGFLYFAINGLLGELKEIKDITRLMNCIFYLFIGLYFMYLFALFEE